MTRTRVTRRLLAFLFFGLALGLGLALALAVLRGSSVAILTGTGGTGNTEGSPFQMCYTDSDGGELVTDPTYGTALIEHDPTGRTPDHRYPVM